MADSNKQESFIEKTKAKLKDTTIKTRILAVTLIFGLCVVIMSAVLSVSIDPETFTDPVKRNDWIVRTLIMVAISTFGIIMGEQIALDVLLQKEGGKYQVALAEYHDERLKIFTKLEFFADWFVWFKAQELRRKQESFLISEGMNDDYHIIIDHLMEIDTKGISEHSQTFKDGTSLLRKTERQALAIKFIQDGNITIECYESGYYVSKDHAVGSATQIEKGRLLDRLEEKDKWFSRSFKIISVILTSTLWAMITASDFMDGTDVQAWMNLFSRIFSLVGAFTSGWLSASRTKDIRVAKINDKIDVLMTFDKDLASGKFKPMTYEEKLRKEAEENGVREKVKDADREDASDNAVAECPSDTRQSDPNRLVGKQDSIQPVEAK